jgi:dinuclear metal center YbgI/SA1388 family protein
MAASVRVADLLEAVAEIAPPDLAAEWDNVGLLAGKPEWPATRTLIAIDLTDAVAREALRSRANALVVYHPPIFKGIRHVTAAAESPTALLPDLLAARISVFAMHTALDAAAGGTNDVLLDFFDVSERRPLEASIVKDGEYKLVVFVPAEEVEMLRRALSRAGAGRIGHYEECSFELRGRGSFRGDETTNPTIGRRQTLEFVDEVRLEMVVPKRRVGDVVRALYANHSYEEPAFDLYPLHTTPARGAAGMGRVATLKKPMGGKALLNRLRGKIDLSAAQVVGDLRRRFRSVTAAAGSFGVKSFSDPASLVLTGEMKHHDALELIRRGVTAVCLGHYASERPVLDVVIRKLRERLPGVRVSICRADAAPFQILP